jgi:hypothetical protein
VGGVLNDQISQTFAVNRALSLYFMVGVVVVGALWYVGAVLINRRKGVDLSLAFREIPPE